MYPNINPHIFRVYRVFWSLESFEDLPKKAGEVDAIEHIAGSRKLEKT